MLYMMSGNLTPQKLVDKSPGVTNRFGQVSGTSDASKTQLGLIRVEARGLQIRRDQSHTGN
jgi:hypothetical protein